MTEEIAPQRAAIRDLMVEIQKDLNVGKDEYNKFGGYAFRNAEGILRAAKPLAARRGAYFQIRSECEPTASGLWMTVHATLVASDESTETASFSGPVAPSRKGMVEEQLSGSARSYYLKYALQDLLAISDGDDDPDARDNTKEGAARPAPKPTPKKPSAKAEYWNACRELADATGGDAKEIANAHMPAEVTDAGFKAAAEAVRKELAAGGDYSTEDIVF